MLNRSVLSALILLPASLAGAQQSAASPAPARASAEARATVEARTAVETRAAAVARGQVASSPMIAGFEPARAEWSARFPQDPADSVYREARSQLNRGEWRRASTLFGQVAQRQPASAYAADALYWQAFALYRIGGVTELREALAALDSRKSRFPRAGNSDEAETLTTRVSGALAARGDASAQGRVRASASGAATSCDSEELSVRASALSVLMRNNPDQAMPIATKVLERRDECSVSLRRNAVMMVGNTGDAASRAKLLDVAKTDPSPSVRSEAVGYLGKSGEEVVPMLESVIRSDSSENVQRSAVRALGANQTPKARAAIRALVERSSAPERLRLEALSTFDRGAAQLYSNFCGGGESCFNVTGTFGSAEQRFAELRGAMAGTAPTPPAAPRPAPMPAVAPVAPTPPVPPVASVGGFSSAGSGQSAAYNAYAVDASAYTFSRSGDDTPERRISPEDAAWLRGVYPRLETTRLKSSAASVLTRAADEPTNTWLMALVQRDEEPSEVRSAILARLGRDLPIANLSRLYDTGSSRTLRQQVMQVLGARTEPEATDKLIEIARTGTDPQLRQSAISALSRKKDPRTMQLLLELIDR
ncbi:MAG: HEAT repeat domain-containing protein [Gemmatimonadetes bacterium]|nr:HEAT repeat domain-containing protein [Gemmatimonadota bacterium]